MTLSRLEIQQMLREMNVKFDADETIEALKQRLQKKNHSLWLNSVSGNRITDGKSDKFVVRKRKKASTNLYPKIDPPNLDNPEVRGKSTIPPTSGFSRASDPTCRPLPIEKPAPGKQWKAAADGTEPFNRKKKVRDSVLRRARMCCEYCGKKVDPGAGKTGLAPYHILPLSQGGEHSIKNVVALCSACLDAMQTDPDPKAVKALKRKARTKLYDSLQVSVKKTGCPRREHRRYRK